MINLTSIVTLALLALCATAAPLPITSLRDTITPTTAVTLSAAAIMPSVPCIGCMRERADLTDSSPTTTETIPASTAAPKSLIVECIGCMGGQPHALEPADLSAPSSTVSKPLPSADTVPCISCMRERAVPELADFLARDSTASDCIGCMRARSAASLPAPIATATTTISIPLPSADTVPCIGCMKARG